MSNQSTTMVAVTTDYIFSTYRHMLPDGFRYKDLLKLSTKGQFPAFEKYGPGAVLFSKQAVDDHFAELAERLSRRPATLRFSAVNS